MKEAAARHIPIWSEVEVAYRLTDAEILAVTGTNGKTTTTTLLGDIMKAAGRETVKAAISGTVFRNRRKICRKKM